MEFVRFLENRFQEVRLAQDSVEKDGAYHVSHAAETLAIQAILHGYRTTMKWLMVPKLFGHFACVLLGFSKAPEPVLVNMIKANKEAEQKKELEKKAKSVGMLQMVQNQSETTEPTPA